MFLLWNDVLGEWAYGGTNPRSLGIGHLFGLKCIFNAEQLKALVRATLRILQLLHFVDDGLDVRRAPHHEKHEHVQLKVDN